MTAGELIARADALRANHYPESRKLLWLQRLDGQIYGELLKPRGMGAEPIIPYTAESALLIDGAYGEELYLAYLFCQIDLNNAEIMKYNQSASLLSAAWRALADSLNREKSVESRARFLF